MTAMATVVVGKGEGAHSTLGLGDTPEGEGELDAVSTAEVVGSEVTRELPVVKSHEAMLMGAESKSAGMPWPTIMVSV